MRSSASAPLTWTGPASSVIKLQSCFRGRRNSRRVFVVVLALVGAWIVLSFVANPSSVPAKLGGFGGGAAGGGRGKHGSADKIDAGLLVQLESEPLKYAVKTMDDADVGFLKRSFLEGDKNKDSKLDLEELNALLFMKTIQRSTALLRDNMVSFAQLDQHPRDGVVSWSEYIANHLEKIGVHTDGTKEKVEEAVKALNRSSKEDVMGLKAAWFESVRGDPDRLNIDEFLAFRHPEHSHSFLLKIVEDVSNILDSNGDGDLSLEEFKELKLDDVSMDNFALRSLFDKDLSLLFRIIDNDGNGVVARKELLEFLDQRNPTHSRREARRLIASADSDRDGYLSADEVVESGPVFLACRFFNPEGFQSRFTSQS